MTDSVDESPPHLFLRPSTVSRVFLGLTRDADPEAQFGQLAPLLFAPRLRGRKFRITIHAPHTPMSVTTQNCQLSNGMDMLSPRLSDCQETLVKRIP